METKKNLLVKPNLKKDEFIQVSPISAGWEFIHFAAVKLTDGKCWFMQTEDNEMAVIIFGGSARIETKNYNWSNVGSRTDVFSGMPTTVYIPKGDSVRITALTGVLEFGVGWCKAVNDHQARLITPEEV